MFKIINPISVHYYETLEMALAYVQRYYYATGTVLVIEEVKDAEVQS